MTLGAEVEGAPGLYSVAFDLAPAGYSTHEHFVSIEALGTIAGAGRFGS